MLRHFRKNNIPGKYPAAAVWRIRLAKTYDRYQYSNLLIPDLTPESQP